MRYEEKLLLKKDEIDHINNLLKSKNGLKEDDIIVNTVNFGNGFEMDIKACGSQDGFPWAEAVLFYYGCEVGFSEPKDFYSGRWELKYNGDTYVGSVECEN